MIRATQVKPQHRWTGTPADTVVLDFEDRHRRRVAMTGTRGLAFLLDLENAVALRGGDALVLEDGRLVEVVAAAEPLLEIKGSDPHHLIRVAWHLGNRHLPTQIMPKALRIRRDHVIEAMVKGLGARVVEIDAPFDPEGGAYGSEHGHAQLHGDAAHEHAPDHGHAHHHDHDHGHHHDHHHDDHCGHEQHRHGHSHAHGRK
jgi:urease accessory protein